MIKPTTNKKALCFSVMPQKLQRPQGLPSAANNIPVIHQNANKEDDKKKGTTIAAVPFLCSFNA